jgi:hypothetical protein
MVAIPGPRDLVGCPDWSTCWITQSRGVPEPIGLPFDEDATRGGSDLDPAFMVEIALCESLVTSRK